VVVIKDQKAAGQRKPLVKGLLIIEANQQEAAIGQRKLLVVKGQLLRENLQARNLLKPEKNLPAQGSRKQAFGK